MAISSDWSLSNNGIKSADNILLVLNALHHRDPERKLTVTFDEYHQGYGRGKGIASLITFPAKLGLAQIAMAFLLLVFAVSRRFGTPIPLRESARQRSEYLSSMSSLLRRGRATRLVRSELGQRFKQDVARSLGLPPSAEPEAILEAATRNRPDKAEALRELLNLVSSQNDIDEGALLALTARWHDMRKELMRLK